MKEFLDLDPAVGFAVNVQLLLVELVQLSHLERATSDVSATDVSEHRAQVGEIAN